MITHFILGVFGLGLSLGFNPLSSRSGGGIVVPPSGETLPHFTIMF